MQLNQPAIERSAAHVQVSYGWHEGDMYRRTFDQADRSVVWHRADDASSARLAEQGYTPGGAVYGPEVETWTVCEEPRS